ncbi:MULTISPECIES: peptidoglycan recognition protein family protein [unclassified Nocardiopsis]|uniref:peptidoglycan recognition protein family protein n=1 Tax=Nocardiopsis TaxID=2013 RepID=UPI00387A8CC2
MQLERRSVFGWGATGAASAPCNLGIVIHYDGSNQNLAGKSHTACRDYWKRTRSFHVGPSRRWADIGYSFGVCPHGIVLEGRGARRAQAAQPGGNTTWTSVTLMGGPSDAVTSAQIEGVRELRAWLRKNHGLGTGVRGHRDFLSTSCPGGIAYVLVKNGTFGKAPSGSSSPSPGPGASKPVPEVKAPAFPLAKGHWFGPQSSNPRNHSGFYAAARPGIRQIRDRLRERGWSVPRGDRYDLALANTIKAFQREKKIKVDGLTGAQTWRALWEAPVT